MSEQNQQNRHVTPEIQLYFKEAMKDAIVETMETFGLYDLRSDVEVLKAESLRREGEEKQKGKNFRIIVLLITAVQVASALFIKFYKQ